LLVELPFDECLTACPGVVLTGNPIELVGSLRAPREALLGFHDIGILGPWRGGAPITEESFCASVPPLRAPDRRRGIVRADSHCPVGRVPAPAGEVIREVIRSTFPARQARL